MIPQCPQKKRSNLFFPKTLILILILAGIFSHSANAQLYQPFSPFGLPATSPYLPFSQVPTYPYFTPFSNPLRNRLGLPTASIMGNLAPFPSPLAIINSEEEVEPVFLGVTTIFIDPAITLLDKVVVKPLDADPIKLSAIIPPLTVYIYPSGYVPATLAPAPVPTPVTVVTPTTVTVPATPITPAITVPPATAITPAAVSGGLWPFFPLFPPIL